MTTAGRLDGPVLVSGATGLHGGAVTRALLAAGRPVRALSRDRGGEHSRQLAQLGVEMVVGDLLDTSALTAAMHGVSAVYAVTTPFSAGPEGEIAQGQSIIAAARQVQVPWLILASVASADRSTGIPHFESKARIEHQLRASGVAHTVVAPSYFYENLGDLAEIVTSGALALPLSASRPLQQVALADLGALVVGLLDRRAEFVGRRIEVASDQPTPREMADALSASGRRTVRYERTDLGARSDDIAAMYRYLDRTGYQVDIAAVRAQFPEVAWRRFAEWAEQQLRG